MGWRRSIVLAGLLAAACRSESAAPSAEATTTTSTSSSTTEPVSQPTDDLVALLPPLPGYTVRDNVDVHELTESLAHGTLRSSARMGSM